MKSNLFAFNSDRGKSSKLKSIINTIYIVVITIISLLSVGVIIFYFFNFKNTFKTNLEKQITKNIENQKIVKQLTKEEYKKLLNNKIEIIEELFIQDIDNQKDLFTF